MAGKILVAYFSASGRTRGAAEEIAGSVDGELYEITPLHPYTDADLDWNDKNSRSTVEMNDDTCRPAIAGALPDIARYDTIFIGFPVWWYVEPRIVDTFVESCDFAGKVLIPFATSGGSGISGAEKRLKSLCPKADLRAGKLVNSGAAAWARKTIKG